MATPVLIYLHGFLSSPGTLKARQLGDYLRAQAISADLRIPLLPDEASSALEAAEATLRNALADTARVALVGSSMGGFYATILAQRYDLRAVLINPAVAPHRLIHRHLGRNRNPYTWREFTLDETHVAQLEAMQPQLVKPDLFWLLAQSGDEVLDYREAVAFYARSKQTVEAGGDHQFRGFERYLPALINFLQCAPV
ncbi:MAG TPA: YqiA/YcfP family alpha/beta fold hydrolase [Spongiibacteraceae bacterium]